MSAAYRLLGRARGMSAFSLESDHWRILVATALVGSLTLGVKIVTMLREVLVAHKLGTGDAVEAYIAAWVIPGFLAMVIADAIVGALLPLHARARAERGEEAGQQVFAEILLISVLVLLAITALLAVLPPLVLPYLTSGFNAEKLELAHRLWLIMLPAAFLTGLALIWTGMLNAGDRFGLAAISPVAAPIASGFGLVLAPGRAVDAMAVGFVLGCLIQVLALGRELRRHGIRGVPGWHGGLPETRSLFRLSLPLIGNGIVFGGLPLVDTAMAATLGDRQLAILSYGNRLILPILGISSMALATVVLPYFSRLVAEGDWRGLQRTLTTYTRLILLASIPITVALVLMSGSVVQALFERGQFTADDTTAVARVQAVLALMIPAYALGVLYSRVLISLRKTQLMLISSVLVFVVNVIGDYLLKEWIGIEGIALATVVNYCLQLAITWWICRRLLRAKQAEGATV